MLLKNNIYCTFHCFSSITATSTGSTSTFSFFFPCSQNMNYIDGGYIIESSVCDSPRLNDKKG